jgi:hypothetical protein
MTDEGSPKDEPDERCVKQTSNQAMWVAVRLRPLVAHEKGQRHCFEVTDEKTLTVVGVEGKEDSNKFEGKYKFDLAMDSTNKSKQTFVSNDMCFELTGKRLVDHVMKGFNTCLFCYGQTGTGKTTTIMGDAENGPGVMPRVLAEIFSRAREFKHRGCTLGFQLQMMEVYNETIHDLLAPRDPDRRSKV